MKKRMLDDVYILGEMALLGQATVFYGGANVGKTLLTIYMLIESIKAGRISGSEVFYINADDSHKGLVTKLELAEKHGFNLLAPGHKGFQAKLLIPILEGMVNADSAKGKILILDTAKKFVDLMDKQNSSAFAEKVRQFVLRGGSVVMLAHVNKHRGDDGKVVYSGTTDLKDDADCSYTLDIVKDDVNGTRTIRFENIKNRGDVVREAVYRYDASEHTPYIARLDSVCHIEKEHFAAVEEDARLEATFLKNKDVIEAIKEVLSEHGDLPKTDLVRFTMDESGFSRSRVRQVLNQHNGFDVGKFEFWHTRRGEDVNAKKLFVLN